MGTSSRLLLSPGLSSVASSPAVAMGLTYIAMANSLGLAMQNAVATQQRAQITASAATTIVMAKIIQCASG
jgi:F0F1-type ATP synthase membrane subunit a